MLKIALGPQQLAPALADANVLTGAPGFQDAAEVASRTHCNGSAHSLVCGTLRVLTHLATPSTVQQGAGKWEAMIKIMDPKPGVVDNPDNANTWQVDVMLEIEVPSNPHQIPHIIAKEAYFQDNSSVTELLKRTMATGR
jgi:hypothetical protein